MHAGYSIGGRNQHPTTSLVLESCLSSIYYSCIIHQISCLSKIIVLSFWTVMVNLMASLRNCLYQVSLWYVWGKDYLNCPNCYGNTHSTCEQHLLVAGRREAPHSCIILTFTFAETFIHSIVVAFDSLADRRISFFRLPAWAEAQQFYRSTLGLELHIGSGEACSLTGGINTKFSICLV